MLRIAICNDTRLQIERLSHLLRAFLSLPYKVDFFLNDEAFEKTLGDEDCTYHLVFIDVELGSDILSGITLAKKINLKYPNTQIIFTSRSADHISNIYETRHTYFIRNAQLETYLPTALKYVLQNLNAMEEHLLYFSRHHDSFHLPVKDILYMERIMRYTEIHTLTDVFSADEKIDRLLAQLPPFFCHCHRSFAANLNAASSLTRTELFFPSGQKIPVSRNYYENVKKYFSEPH